MRTPFDPLQFLQSEMSLSLDLDSKGKVVVEGMNRLLPHQYKQAKAVLKTYDRLLRLQLNAPSKRMRPSVRKLMAQGKIEIRDRRYVLCENHSMDI
jgi:hypothetical protein